MRNKEIIIAKAQEELLTEISDFSKAITRKIGQGTGVVQGLGQKIAGTTRRGVKALGKSFQQGKQQTQKAVAGKDYKAPQGGPGFLKKATGAITTGIGRADALAQKALDKIDDAGSYNPYADNAMGDRSQQTYTGVGGAQIGKNPRSSNLTQRNRVASATAQTQPQTQATKQATAKRAKTGGRVKGQTSQTASAQYQRNRRAAQKSAVSRGINQVRSQGPIRDASGKIVSTGSGPLRDRSGKIVTPTAQNIARNANVSTAKIGGQKIDLNDPSMANIRRQIQKQA